MHPAAVHTSPHRVSDRKCQRFPLPLPTLLPQESVQHRAVRPVLRSTFRLLRLNKSWSNSFHDMALYTIRIQELLYTISRQESSFFL